VDHEFHDASEVALGGQVMVHKLCAYLAVALVASVSIAQISEDDRSKLEGWWYRCERPLSDDIVTRLEQRVQEDPADGEAAFYLSQVLRLGAGDRPVDLNRSMHLLQESAVMGFPAAQARLAMHKMMGQGVEYDREGAIQLFDVAMEQNEPDAFLYRGILLLNNADPTDTQLAVAEADLKRALELGAVAALFPLSHLTALRGDRMR
jgi:TPR repeat protein